MESKKKTIGDVRNEVIEARLYYESYGRNGLRDALDLLELCENALREFDELDERRINNCSIQMCSSRRE